MEISNFRYFENYVWNVHTFYFSGLTAAPTIATFFYHLYLFVAETSSCGEKVKDCEEHAKAGMEKLKKSIEENEKFFRKEMWQIREQTGAWRL